MMRKMMNRKLIKARPPKSRFQPWLEMLERRQVMSGFQTLAPAYLVPSAPSVEITPLITVGESVNLKPDGVTPYRAVGIMDGLGAYDNGDGTFMVLMNHEIPVNIAAGTTASPVGGVREHGNAGAFVSQWIINKSDLSVVKGEDFLANNTSIFLSNNDPSTCTVHTAFLPGDTTLISRLCSADLAAPSAHIWTDPSSGITYGTSALIFETGEEAGGIVTAMTAGFSGDLGPEGAVHFGRQFAFIATDDTSIPGDQSNTAFELPHHGLFAWENNLTSPYAQRKTVVMGMDDSNGGQLYIWVGDKQTTGNVVERAGLTKQSANDNLYVIKVATTPLTDDDSPGTNPGPSEARATPLSGTFTLENEGDVSGLTFAQLEALSDSKGGAQFLRPEDGQWDPNNPNDFYFVTTDRYDEIKDNTDGPDPEADGTNDNVVDQVGRSRLYRLRFTDITKPELGGTIEAVLDGTEAGNMFDNMTIDSQGRVFLQEDAGNQAHSSKIWVYDIATDELIEIAQHNPALFGDLGVAATAPYNQDEESSGIVSLEHILGDGYYLADVQAHYLINAANPRGFDNPNELVEGGQLLVINTSAASASLEGGTLTVEGTIDDDKIVVEKSGSHYAVYVNGEQVGKFRRRDVHSIEVSGHHGDDSIRLESNVTADTVVHGGAGNDWIFGSGGSNELFGDEGNDVIFGKGGADQIHGGDGNDWLFGGNGADALFGGAGNDVLFGENGADLLDGGDDDDWLFGGSGADALLNGEHNFQ